MRRSYTYGVLPPFSDFEIAFNEVPRSRLGFYWELKGIDARIMEKIGFSAFESWDTAEALYKDLEKMIGTDDPNSWRVLDVVSSVLTVLGFEWI